MGPGGTKLLVLPEGMMKSNAKLVDLIERVKPEIRTLIEKCNTVSLVYMHTYIDTHTHTSTHTHENWHKGADIKGFHIGHGVL